eukprot:CAMPEP_0184404140 /NCGR_PEP_ID=MMETSP0007-20130409/85781_1 /TAXON_ID=97485 /ORGANISM="Prymnesium parvum, Strain Texoma1" /LENGTH=187 /DNA_ID=CAMNT_0026760279 /DNA_START=9 /DNA_END=573 /DNA_ORIENTATION=-
MRHHFQILFQPPAVHNNGMESASVDMLHLIYLNVFKMLFSYTIHQNLPDAKKKLVRNYLKAASFYSYDAAADNSENPVMRWIGREVKKFIADAPIHLPFLLRLVAGMDRSVPSSWLVAGTYLVEASEGGDEALTSPAQPAEWTVAFLVAGTYLVLLVVSVLGNSLPKYFGCWGSHLPHLVLVGWSSG